MSALLCRMTPSTDAPSITRQQPGTPETALDWIAATGVFTVPVGAELLVG